MHNLGVGEIAARNMRRLRGVVASLTRPPYSPPGHFYSPTTTAADRTRAIAWRHRSPIGIDLREANQEKLATKLEPLMADLPEDRWQPDNAMFGRADAAVLHAMLRHHRPVRYLEVGSGYSTAVAFDVAERWLPELQVTCVEPHPARLLSRLRPTDSLDLLQQPVQDIDAKVFGILESGDVLFIDSTHVVKPGSDVVWLYLHVLPTLAPGVLVHIHDIHWPFEYPQRWLAEGRDWTEVYLLRALLIGSSMWQIELMTSWLWTQRPLLVPEQLQSAPTGSLWMRRMA